MKRARVSRSKKLNSLIIKRWPFGCLLFLFLNCRQQTKFVSFEKYDVTRLYGLNNIRPHLQNGDLIFRNGTDEVSRAARSFNRIDTSFSHCGIILLEHDTAFVYHALGGDYNPSQVLRRDLLDSFWMLAEIDRIGIYRYNLNQQENDSLSAIVQRYHAARLPFDLYFNFLTDDKMYCSEFVFKCFDQSLSGQLSQTIQARKWPFGISPDDLFLFSRSQLVGKINFNK
jgi:hypothetical protein